MRNYLHWPFERVRYCCIRFCWIGLLILSGCTSTATDINNLHIKLDQGQTQTIELRFNQTMIVDIASNPTTGYRWELQLQTRERRCYIATELLSETSHETQNQPMRAGAPSFQKWSIKIDPDFPCTRDQQISWSYRRPWEPLNNQNPVARILLKPTPK